MSIRTSIFVALGLLVASGIDAAAQISVEPAPRPEPTGELALKAVEELKQSTLAPKLGNGSVADPLAWPASFYGVYNVGADYASCTATLVAARALLTAAHCISDGGSVAISRNGATFRGTCRRPANGYPGLKSLDVAMCLMDTDVPAFRYEVMNLASSPLKRDLQLLLAGFGCTQIGGQSDGVFRTGPAFVQFLPGQLTGYPQWLATYAAKQRGDAFICPGDSGGAVYVEQPVDLREIVAVNSHYDTAAQGISFLTVLSAPASAAFIRDWADSNGQRLCGVHNDAQNCR